MATVFTSPKTEYQFYLKLTLEEIAPGTATSDPQLSYTLQLYSGGYNFNLLRIKAHVKLGGIVVAQLNPADKQWTLDTHSNITLLSGTATVPHNGNNTMAVEYAIEMSKDVLESVPVITAYGDMPVTAYAKGIVYIDNGGSLDAYQCYIDNGSGWDLCIPFIDNGSSWNLCS